METTEANRILDAALATGPRCGPSHVIALDGPAGSGKTTLAAEIAAEAGARGLSCEVVATDEICPGWDGLPVVPGVIEDLLVQLSAGSAATHPTWDWQAGRPGPEAVVAAADVIIIEGVGSGSRRCVRYFSTRILLDAPPDLRRRRALARDGDMFAPHWDRWAEAEGRYFADNWV